MTQTCDAMIISAGVISACRAFELAKVGYRTLSPDKVGAAGHGSTSSSRAIIRLYYSNVESCALAYEYRFYWKDWEGYLGARDPREMIVHRDTGALVMKRPENGQMERAATLMGDIYAPYEYWGPERMRQRFPFFDLRLCSPSKRSDRQEVGEPAGGELQGALFFPCGGDVSDPGRNAEFAARHRGAEFHFNADVAEILTKSGRAADVGLADGQALNAPVAVNVSGPHSSRVNRMAGFDDEMRVKARALRYEIAQAPTPPGRGIMNDGCVAPDSDLATDARPEKGGYVPVGSELPPCDTREWVGSDDWSRDLTDQARAQAMRLAQRYIGPPIPNKVKDSAGLYNVTGDWIPIYDGTAPSGFHVDSGASGDRLRNAPVVGKMMKTLITECQAARDDHAKPAIFRFENVGIEGSIGFFSRNRAINPNSSFSVLG